ncbi:glycoside hydrolase family protein [Paenibacillus albus]|uniref:Glycosyl hydrolase family 32 N-terminal domain-containing protein n=1 Tax=Paenibacillus albus TaxID=2495582 RepID=A0A3Q8X9G9_9BACL|nr:hypothetical protein [Paenibacillus albus]AZN43421.1 hypothetical protein EJC50_29825 [Paenibacillus albus]
MSTRLWNLFTNDYRQNCLRWSHSANNPVIPASGESWKSIWVANPDFLEFQGKQLLYYRGNGIQPGTDGQRHDRLAVAEVLQLTADNIEIRDLNGGEPIVDAGAPGEFDSKDVLDPASVVWQDQVFVYYSAVGDGPDSVGLAISSDGEHFTKYGKIMDGRAPEVIVKDGKLHMIYQMFSNDGYQLHLASSEDGIHFTPVSDKPIFQDRTGGWDSLSIVTVRLMQDDEYYYMIYGASAYLADEPDFFGLARSRDLLNWESHPGNPIFGCGAKGSEDGGAIWFPAIVETEEHFVMIYEGSRGKYTWDLSSQICLSSIRKD